MFHSGRSRIYQGSNFHNGLQMSEMSKDERDFLNYAASGDLASIEQLVRQHMIYCRYIDFNCCDPLDRTALSLAIIHGHLEVVEYLLGNEDLEGLNLGESLFYAIQNESYKAIELLLEKDPQTALRIPPGTTSPFEPGLTPFKFAAHKNNYRILSILYRYSHRLTFSDNELIVDENMDSYSWDAVKERLLHYRARASPCFMLLMYYEKGMAWDPLNASMDLFGKLKKLAKKEREVEEAYNTMAKECENFAVELLKEVRSSNELADLMRYSLESDHNETISQDTSSLSVVSGISSDESIVARRNKNLLKPIEKAVEYEMKDFVTSDNSQLALIYVQKGSLFRKMKGQKAFVTQVFLGVVYPLLTLAYIIAPHSSPGKLLRNPTVRFWCWIMSEIYFVVLLIANTVLIQYDELASDHLSWVLVAGSFWILGKLIQEISELRKQPLSEYFLDPWNLNDLATIITYFLYILLRFIHDRTSNKTHSLREGHGTDLLQLSDAFIAIAYVLVHIRILEILRVERTFGPLQVSLERMAKDAISFSVILLIIFLAFSSGLCELFTPYGPGHNCTCNYTTDCDPMKPLVQLWIEPNYTSADNATNFLPACVACRKDVPDENQVTTLLNSLSGIWWTTFGYGNPRDWYLISNCPDKFYPQEIVGFFIVAIYHFAVIIVLFNMLIAMMSNSFQLTQDDSVREWKFYRTQLWLKLVSNKITRLPPMNIIPELRHVKKLGDWMGKLVMKIWFKMQRSSSGDTYQNEGITGSSGANTISLGRRRNAQAVITSPEDAKYEQVLHLIVLRYVKKKVLRCEMKW